MSRSTYFKTFHQDKIPEEQTQCAKNNPVSLFRAQKTIGTNMNESEREGPCIGIMNEDVSLFGNGKQRFSACLRRNEGIIALLAIIQSFLLTLLLMPYVLSLSLIRMIVNFCLL